MKGWENEGVKEQDGRERGRKGWIKREWKGNGRKG